MECDDATSACGPSCATTRHARAMSRASIDCDVSLMRDTDRHFVLSGWKRSAREAPQHQAIPSPKFFAGITRQIEALLARPTVSVFVARHHDDGDALYGFACMEQRGPALALHYVYTRQEDRRRGVCSDLLRHALQGASDADTLVYTAGSRFDAQWERWGFSRAELGEWLRGTERPVKDLIRPDIRHRQVSKTVKSGGVR